MVTMVTAVYVFQASITVEISYFEIYNEKIHDLLGPSNKDRSGKKVNVRDVSQVTDRISMISIIAYRASGFCRVVRRSQPVCYVE